MAEVVGYSVSAQDSGAMSDDGSQGESLRKAVS